MDVQRSLLPQYHDEVPLSKAPNPQLLPGCRSINGCPLLWVCSRCVCVCVCVCSLLCVCSWMGKMQSTDSEYGSQYLAVCHFHFFSFKFLSMYIGYNFFTLYIECVESHFTSEPFTFSDPYAFEMANHIYCFNEINIRIPLKWLESYFTPKNAGLNTTHRWVKYGQTQRLGCLDPAVGLNI